MVCAFWAKCHSNGEFFEELLGKNVACKATHIRYGPEVKGRFSVGSLGERYSKWKWLSYRSKQIDVCETAVGGSSFFAFPFVCVIFLKHEEAKLWRSGTLLCTTIELHPH